MRKILCYGYFSFMVRPNFLLGKTHQHNVLEVTIIFNGS